jgi:hypothetical protein
MPALLLLALLVPLLAGCVPGGARSDGVPTADAPFTLVALDVGQPIIRFRGRTVTWCHYSHRGHDCSLRESLR